MTQLRITPRNVADRARTAGAVIPSTELVQQFAAAMPRLHWFSGQLGLDVAAALLEWTKSSDSATVAGWLSDDATGSAIARRWKLMKIHPRHNLLQALIVEKRISVDAYKVAPWLRGYGDSYDQVLHKAREYVAIAAFDHAHTTIAQGRRTVTARALELSVTYLRHLVDLSRLSGDIDARLQRRFGRAVILLARYSTVDISSLAAAQSALADAREKGLRDVAAHELEALKHLYDVTGDADYLRQGARLTSSASDHDRSTLEWNLDAAEVWLKLAATDGVTSAARVAFVARCKSALTAAGVMEARLVDELRGVMLGAFCDLVAEAPDSRDVNLRWLAFPFVLRDNSRELPPSFASAVPKLINLLRPIAAEGAYLSRDVFAELISYHVRAADLSARDKQTLLHEAINVRQGRKLSQSLLGERVEVQQAQDHLLLASLEGTESRRRVGLDLLARASMGQRAPALTMIARDIENNGPFAGQVLSPRYGELAAQVRRGDFRSIYRDAAVAAIANPDHKRLRLGGRGDVVALADVSALSGQTFVYKKMSAACQRRDELRSSQIARHLLQDGLSGAFDVVEHVANVRVASSDPLSGIETEVVSVRRYLHGTPLASALRDRGHEPIRVLTDATRFLAYIQAVESNASKPAFGVRRLLKERELGRWLRQLFARSEAGEIFEEWWGCVRDAPHLPRRDAHPHNWIVDARDRIVALDFDSKDDRPFGVELAQLIEDSAALPADKWDVRLRLLRVYVAELRRRGHLVGVSDEMAESYFVAGVIMRSLWLLTSGKGEHAAMRHGGELLSVIRSRYHEHAVGRLAARIHRQWLNKVGVARPDHLDALHPAERGRISRAMAYHLRHDPIALVNLGGWMHVEELAATLRAGGHHVTTDQVRQIAGSMGEPRFELERDEIRARYAHSRDVPLGEPKDFPSVVLYHGTPTVNLASVFEAQGGLVKGRRQFVHLTSNLRTALRASERRHSPSVVLEVSAVPRDKFHQRADETWLIGHIPSPQLSVLTLNELAETLASSFGAESA